MCYELLEYHIVMSRELRRGDAAALVLQTSWRRCMHQKAWRRTGQAGDDERYFLPRAHYASSPF